MENLKEIKETMKQTHQKCVEVLLKNKEEYLQIKNGVFYRITKELYSVLVVTADEYYGLKYLNLPNELEEFTIVGDYDKAMSLVEPMKNVMSNK